MVFQYPEYQLFAETVREDVGFGPKNMGLDEQEIDRRVRSAMELVGLDWEEFAEKSPFELSGGMCQRVGIVMAMLLRPQVLLADEPTSALDASVEVEVMRELLALRAQFGTAIMLVTHDMGVAARMADRLLVLKDGRMVEIGSAADVLCHPQADYTRALIAATPRLRKNAE